LSAEFFEVSPSPRLRFWRPCRAHPRSRRAPALHPWCYRAFREWGSARPSTKIGSILVLWVALSMVMQSFGDGGYAAIACCPRWLRRVIGAFWLERAVRDRLGRKNESASQASSVSRSQTAAAPPSSDGGVSTRTARGARPSRSAASKAARTKGSRIKDERFVVRCALARDIGSTPVA
jgi:hypothetical protein